MISLDSQCKVVNIAITMINVCTSILLINPTNMSEMYVIKAAQFSPAVLYRNELLPKTPKNKEEAVYTVRIIQQPKTVSANGMFT